MHIRKNKAWFEQNSYLMLFLHGVNNFFLRLSVLSNPAIIFLLEFCEAHLLIVVWLDLCSRVLVMLTHSRLHVISYFSQYRGGAGLQSLLLRDENHVIIRIIG